MNVLRQSNDSIIGFLGGIQLKVKNKEYRYNQFVMKTEFNEDEEVWVNLFTGAVISISKTEIDNISLDYPCIYADYLVENYFLVPKNFNELELVEDYRKRNMKPITPNSLDHLNSFTILTTTECNARCFYCYQHSDKNKHHMTEETAKKVVRYITETTFPNQDVFIGWFGGEPTYNSKVIDIITTGVKATGRRIFASMISNGYLFNKKLVEKAASFWGLNNIQITLDGTEEIYNKTKRYIYKDDPNPFKTVIHNIHDLANHNISVIIRLNCGEHNLENLKELVEFIGEEFKDNRLVSVYLHELFDKEGKRTEEQNKTIFKNMIELQKLLYDKHMMVWAASLPYTIQSQHCMVDSNDSVIIAPSGEVGLCEHYQNSKFVCDVDHPYEKDFDVIRSWRQMSEFESICDDCKFRPACLKCKQCPDHRICNPYEKEFRLYQVATESLAFYERWIIE